MEQSIIIDRPFLVLFLNNIVETQSEDAVTEYDICEAMEQVVSPRYIIGSQRMQTVWRLYVTNEESKNKLLQQGIGLKGQHLQLYLQNPAKLTR